MVRHRTHAGRRAGAPEPDAALPGPHVCASQRVCLARGGAVAIRCLAGPGPARPAPLHHGAHCPRAQGRGDPGGVAAHRRAARHPSHDRDGGGNRPNHAGWHGSRRPFHGGHAEGYGPGRPTRPRRSGVRALSRPARAVDDGDAPQRREPGGRLHVAREWHDPGRRWCQRHAVGGRDQHRLLCPHRVHRHRCIPVPHPRAVRLGGRGRTRCLPGGAAVSAELNPALDALGAVLVIPATGAVVLALLPGYWLSARLNVLICFASLLAALSLLIERPAPGAFLFVDDLNVVFVVLTTFVAFTTSAFSASYIGHELEVGRLTPRYLRFYHAMYQTLMFAMNLGLLANNIGLMWVAVELATLTTVLMVGIYRTHEAIEAAWKYFILGSVGIALALFGTILVYMAARPVVGEGLDGMVWTTLIDRVAAFDPALLNIAFVFVLLGYGTKVGLAPLHAWLPDAHAEGPTPISAVLSGLLLNVALYAVLRFKMLLAANEAAIAPGPLMATMGLSSLIFAGFMLYRRRDIKRMFAYSSIEHMGIITFAFGMGGPLANFAGLLHMTMHSLTKSAIFFAVGHVGQVKGTQRIAEIRGLTETHPVLGWGLVLGVVAIAGLPPLGIFMSEFLIVSSTFARAPLLALLVVLGLLIAFGALLLRLSEVAFGKPTGSTAPVEASYVPLYAHLALVTCAGIYLPAPLVAWFQAVARLLG